jgi:hypothetical protein
MELVSGRPRRTYQSLNESVPAARSKVRSEGHSRQFGRLTATSGVVMPVQCVEFKMHAPTVTQETDILRIDGYVSKVPRSDLLTDTCTQLDNDDP